MTERAMTFTLRDINAELGKITSHLDPIFYQPEQKYLKTDRDQRLFGEGFNKGVEAQASVPLRFKREELADLLCRFVIDGGLAHSPENYKKEYYRRADAIISAGPTLLEVAKEGEV